MAILGTDLLVVNRGGIDYKAPASALPEFDSSELEELIAAKANLDDKEQSITAKEFIGDGSKLTNIKVDLEGGYVGGPLETAPTAPAMVNDNGEVEPKNEQIEAGTWGGCRHFCWSQISF